jgi:hypothetical protein
MNLKEIRIGSYLNKDKKIHFLKILLLIICVIIIFIQIKGNFQNVLNKIIISKNDSIILGIAVTFFHNLHNLRYFFFLKTTFNFSKKFIDWSSLFFLTAFFNENFFFSGHIARSIELKKSGVGYYEYTSVQYIFLSLGILTNLYLVLIESLFLINSIKFFIIFLILTLLLNLCMLPSCLKYLLKIIQKFSFLKKLAQLFEIIINIIKIKKNILIFILFTIFIHFFEIIIFYILCKIFITSIGIAFILKLFMINFLVQRLPFLSSVIGFKEIIFGSFGILMGFAFLDGILIQLVLRIFFNISFVQNYLIYKIFKFNLKKNIIS